MISSKAEKSVLALKNWFTENESFHFITLQKNRQMGLKKIFWCGSTVNGFPQFRFRSIPQKEALPLFAERFALLQSRAVHPRKKSTKTSFSRYPFIF
ncbi:MAG: hypothetical protein PUE30_07065 [Spirochaetia bacterium]|nr:hypothetical protein [Spirochaetia bacterium]